MTLDPWSAALSASPLLRDLDDGARAQLLAASRLVDLPAGGALYRDGDDSGGFFLVGAGALALHAVRRGEETPALLRVARAGDSLGEEALLSGLRRRATASALEPARVAEIPVPVFRRAIARGDERALSREWRYLERAAARDLLATSALGRGLGDSDGELLLDGVQLERFERGARLFEPGEPADRSYVVLDGLVQIQSEEAERTSVIAYLGRGDLLGDEEPLAGRARRAAAVAAGETWCARVPVELLRTLSDRNPGLMARLRRVAEQRRADQGELLGAAARSTQHVFRDLYRMQMARSLLVIDQDRCVRCGHCAWSCSQVHGVSRLVRRGDKVVTRLPGAPGPARLLLPNTCQHCRHAACMIDCPTGAIGRDPEGEVFIRAELCTGCGNCAKSCPWDNIQMAPRPAPASGLSADVAVKCDLCRGYEAPACVEACPVDAITRLDPTRDFAEVSHIFGGGVPEPIGAMPAATATRTAAAGAARTAVAGVSASGHVDGATLLAALRPASGPARPPSIALPSSLPGASQSAHSPARLWVGALILSAAGAVAILMATLGWSQQTRGAWVPGRGAGLAAGIFAALLIAGLTGYAAPKRLVRRWMRRSSRSRRAALESRPPPRSRLRPHLVAHLGAGFIVPAAALAHAGARLPASPAGALALALLAACLVGAAGALVYRVIPARLTRLERRGALPEDLAGERDALLSRLYLESSGRSDLVKAIAARLLLPHARAPLGWVALVLSGRDLAGEEARLRRRVDQALAGRGQGRLDGVDALVRTAVELRALPARRALTAALRAWLPIHIVSAAAVLALLLLHIGLALR
jgi:Fe-S-cluster-containing dehydrogenase component